PGLTSPDDRKRMPVIGRCYTDHIDFVIVEYTPKILFQVNILSVFFTKLLPAFPQKIHIRITQRLDSNIALCHKTADVVFPPAIDPEDRCVDAIVGTKYTG